MGIFFDRKTAVPVLVDLRTRLDRSASRLGLLRFRWSLLRLTARAARSRTPLTRSDPALRETARLQHFIFRPETPWSVQHQATMRNPPIHWQVKLWDVWSILWHVRLLPFGEAWARWLTARLPS
jgi:hypothetical protein